MENSNKDDYHTEGKWSLLTFGLIISIFLTTDLILNEDTNSVILREELLEKYGTHFQSIVKSIELDLDKNVSHQSDAVNVVKESLNELINFKRNLNVLGLIGSSGVGKTFIANIIKRHFHNFSINELYGPLIIDEDKIHALLYNIQTVLDHFNLIILDDLSVKDVDVFLNFIGNLPNNHLILIIPIFSIQETDDNLNNSINYQHIKEVQSKLNVADITYKLAVLHEFNRNQAADWLKKNFVSKLGKGTDILEEILNDHDLKYEGFKRLQLKVLENLQ